MTPGERRIYFRLWIAACRVNDWDAKDNGQRRQNAIDCMTAVGGPRVTTSSPDFGRDEVTALFCYLEHLGAPGSFDKSAKWDTCLRDYKTYNRARQADWHETKTYGRTRKVRQTGLGRGTSAAGGVLDDLDAEQVRKRHLNFASRHQKKQRREKGLSSASQPVASPAPADILDNAPAPRVIVLGPAVAPARARAPRATVTEDAPF